MAVIKSTLHVGLEADTLQSLGQAEGVARSHAQISPPAWRRVIATTVATTMIAARLAGISVFATGGIGVHKGAETSFDISADLLGWLKLR